MSNGSAVRAFTDTHAHTHTDGTDFIPSTATREGKSNLLLAQLGTRQQLLACLRLCMGGSLLPQVNLLAEREIGKKVRKRGAGAGFGVWH